jgi:hypothetical protein
VLLHRAFLRHFMPHTFVSVLFLLFPLLFSETSANIKQQSSMAKHNHIVSAYSPIPCAHHTYELACTRYSTVGARTSQCSSSHLICEGTLEKRDKHATTHKRQNNKNADKTYNHTTTAT